MLNQVQHYEQIKQPMKTSFIYILTNKNKTTLYIGVTSDLKKRIIQHKEGKGSVFAKKYQLEILLYFEKFTDINQAIAREKQLKNWRKEWKWNLVKEKNPELIDLFFES